MGDFWASTLQSSNHFSAQPTSGNEMVLDNLGVIDDDSARTYFNCPFCYVDIELSAICGHLQEEHCLDVNNAVCPLCALTMGNDVAGHFKGHHAPSIKTQRRSQKSGFWSFYSGRSLHGGLSSKTGIDKVNASAPDPLLSPFLFNVPYSGSKGDHSQQDLCSNNDVSLISPTECSLPVPSKLNLSESRSDSEEMRQRAKFCQQLTCSTFL